MTENNGMEIARERISRERAEQTGSLDLGNLGLTDFPEELATLTHLKSLNVGSKKIDATGKLETRGGGILNRLDEADWSFLKYLQNLKTLAAYKSGIANIEPLLAGQSLIHLLIGENPLRDLSPLSNLNSLQSLDCSHTQVSDLSPLSNLNSLQSCALRLAR